MKNLLKYFKYRLMWLIALLLTACMDDPGTDIVFNDATVEINEATQSINPTASKTYKRFDDAITVKDSLTVNLVGAQRNTPISVSYKLVTDAGATGQKDVHFKITDGTITIPANKSFGKIPFEIIDEAINPGQFYSMIVELTSADVKISQNYKRVTLRITTECNFEITKFIGAYDCDEPGYKVYDVSFAQGADATTVVNNNFWDVGASINYVFNATEKKVIIPSQVFVGNVGRGPENLVVVGDGTIDTCNGKMVVNYTVKTQADNLTADSNTHTFTRK
jgi:hypothetical protein